jgi:hypothetical protein
VLTEAHAEPTETGGHDPVFEATRRREPGRRSHMIHDAEAAIRLPGRRSLFAPCAELELWHARRQTCDRRRLGAG